ncbi:MAG: amidase [Planctomycetes bacterium]|nr:amidase [Planctomycetota bacterium]
MPDNEICYLTAREIWHKIGKHEISATEVMQAHLSQIERVNPKVNAIITLQPDRAMEGAKAADEAIARGDNIGPLHGLPIAVKDLTLTKGIRTTFGSPIFKDNIPDQDAIIVERVKKAGAIVIGKTNVPEFGAGSHTFNPVFGTTLNPYDTSKTCGGSSGGAGVSLACRMLPIADGTDLGGSLRNPANFNNVVGFRPSPGRVPNSSPLGWSVLGVQGPMARTVGDVALFLSAIAGPDSRSPISIEQPGSTFAAPLERDFSGVRIAYVPNLDGLPVDPRVASIIESSVSVFKSLGCTIEQATPDFSNADKVFKTLRAWGTAFARGALLEEHRDMIKGTVIGEIEEGLKLTAMDVSLAEEMRTAYYHRVRTFMETYEFMIMPVNQVPPFAVTTEYPTEINGVPMKTYIDWMKSCYYISSLGHPAASVPCGFTPEGLPVGVQIVGRHHDDFGVLQLASAFEGTTRFGERLPGVLG